MGNCCSGGGDVQEVLAVAAFRGDIELAKEALAHDADVNAPGRDKDGWTPLHWCTYGNHVELARLLLDNGANPLARTRIGGFTPLHQAVYEGSDKLVHLLLERSGADACNIEDADGWTPLIACCHRGNLDAAQVLLKMPNINIGAMDKEGWTALHHASMEGREEVVRVLMAAGADSSALALEGFAPLHQAAYYNRIGAARALIEGGTDLNAQDRDGWTPLIAAASRGLVDMVRLLLESGADPLVQADDGLKAIDKATDEAVRQLLRNPPMKIDDDQAARRRWEKLEHIQRATLEADKRREEAAARRIPAILRDPPTPPTLTHGSRLS